jgi:ABC-2 type transport system permease protein
VAVALDGTPADDLLAELGALDGVERVEPVAAPEELRARLYLSGEAPLLVAPVAATGARRAGAGPARAFLAVRWRDLYVTGRELPVFLAPVVLQPLFLLFVFGKVLTDLGFAQPGYTRVLFPGILALTATVTGLQGTAFPLVIDFSFTKEIEDRLLAPLPVGMVAVEKVVFASLRALLAALVMLPIGVWILGSIPWRPSGLPLFVTVLPLGCLVGSCLGMIMGTAVPPTASTSCSPWS